MTSAKRLKIVPDDAACNEARLLGFPAGDDKYTQREMLLSQLGFFHSNKEMLVLAEYFRGIGITFQSPFKETTRMNAGEIPDSYSIVPTLTT